MIIARFLLYLTISDAGPVSPNCNFAFGYGFLISLAAAAAVLGERNLVDMPLSVWQ